MKKQIIFVIISLLLMGIVSAGLTSKAIVNISSDVDSENQNKNLAAETQEQNQGEDSQIENQIRSITAEQLQKIITARNRLNNFSEECPSDCTCTENSARCGLNNQTREMIINAGNSGNIIVQVKNAQASTQVQLYRDENGKVYGVFKNNQTKQVRMLPDQVQERIRERLQTNLENEEIKLDEDGNYQYQAERQVKILGLFQARIKVQAQIDSETGEVLSLNQPWWAGLAQNQETLLDASCRTVDSESKKECCQNKGYDYYNSETNQCEFTLE